VAKVTVKATGSAESRILEAMVNVDAGKDSSMSSKIAADGAPVARHFTVTAQAGELPLASLQVPLSIDPKDSVLAVAVASVRQADTGGALLPHRTT
jgi:hypothetical protein